MRLELTVDGNFECPDDPGEISYPSKPKRRSVTPEEADILAELATGKHVLEIGTGLAVSTQAMAKRAVEVVTIDIDPWVEDPDLPRVTFLRDRPPIYTGQLFNMAFIDGSHRKSEVLKDIDYCLGIRLIAIHDTYLDEVQEAIDESPIKLIKVYDTRCRLATFTRQ